MIRLSPVLKSLWIRRGPLLRLKVLDSTCVWGLSYARNCNGVHGKTCSGVHGKTCSGGARLNVLGVHGSTCSWVHGKTCT